MSKDEKGSVAYSIVTFLIGLLVVYSVFFGIEYYLANPSPFYVVVSESMRPTLEIGDLVIGRGVGDKVLYFLFIPIHVKGVDPKDLKIGDIIIFRSPDNPNVLIIHRIIKIKNSSNGLIFITKGDNNPVDDYTGHRWLIRESDVVAVYVAHVRHLGSIIGFFKSPYGILLIIGIAAIIIAYDYYRKS